MENFEIPRDLNSEVRNLKKEVAILKKHRERNTQDHLLFSKAICDVINNPQPKTYWSSLSNLFFSIFNLCLSLIYTVLYVAAACLILLFFKYVFIFWAEQYYLNFHIRPSNSLMWKCDYKVYDVPVFNTKETCKYNYVHCMEFDKDIFIDPTTKTKYNNYLDIQNYGFNVLKNKNCTSTATYHEIEEKNKIVHVSTQTIGSDQVFLFNHTLTVYNTINLTSITYSVVLPSTNSVRHVLHYINKIV